MSATHPGPEAEYTHTLAGAKLPARVNAALEALLRVASDELEQRLEGMLVEFEQQLFRLADHARSPGVETGYLQTLRNMRLNRADLIPRFMLGVEANLARIHASSQPEPSSAPTPQFEGLALVDGTEADADMLLRNIAQRSSAGATLPLHLLGQRFGVLAAAPAFDAEHLPIGPHALCQVMKDASRMLQLSADNTQLLLRTFERKAMADYAALAELFNETLASAGILPSLTYVPLRIRPTAVREAPDPGDARQDSPQKRPQPQHRDREHLHTSWHPAAAASEPGGDAAFDMLQELLARGPQAQGDYQRDAAWAAPREGTAATETSSLVSALARIAPLASEGGHDQLDRTIAALKRDVLQRLRNEHGPSAGISRADNDAFDLLDMLYQRIERDVRADSLAAKLLQRLQVPVVQTALLDHGFFARPQHPARQLLNTVAEAGARWLEAGDMDPTLHAPLERAVEHVVRHGETGTAAFEDSNRKLQSELKSQARRSEIAERRHVEAARGKEKLELARTAASKSIAEMIGDHKPPSFIRALLEQSWADVLTLVQLRHGEESDEWRQMQEVTQRIISACCDKKPAPDPELAGHVKKALLTVGYHNDEAVAISHRLSSVEDDSDAASRTELVASLKARTRLGGTDDKKKQKLKPRNPEEQLQYERICALPFGTWFEFTTNQQGDVVRKRLSWYSKPTDNALFVNLRGQRVGEESLDSLARALARGQARVVTVDRARLVDRAWHSTLNAMRNLVRGNRSKKTAGTAP